MGGNAVGAALVIPCHIGGGRKAVVGGHCRCPDDMEITVVERIRVGAAQRKFLSLSCPKHPRIRPYGGRRKSRVFFRASIRAHRFWNG